MMSLGNSSQQENKIHDKGGSVTKMDYLIMLRKVVSHLGKKELNTDFIYYDNIKSK